MTEPAKDDMVERRHYATTLDEVLALRSAITALRAEVAALRAHAITELLLDALPQPSPGASGAIDRDQLIAMLQDLASANMPKEAAKRQARRMADALVAKGLGCYPPMNNDVRHAFRNADDKDWEHLDRLLGHSGHGKFWRAVFAEVRASLVSRDASGDAA